MDRLVFDFTSKLWRHGGDAGWFFVTLPHDVADRVDELVDQRGGFGSIPVEATIGSSTWKTSLFPDRRAASFVLPIKSAVRSSESLALDDPIRVQIRCEPPRTPHRPRPGSSHEP